MFSSQLAQAPTSRSAGAIQTNLPRYNFEVIYLAKIVGQRFRFIALIACGWLVGCGGGGGNNSVQVNPPPALPALSITAGNINEGDTGSSNLSLTVSINKTASTNITVNYASSDGSAQAGSDYTAVNGTLTIPAGDTSATIQVAITGDTLVEADETFTVTLSNPSNATLSAASATATINNDDASTTVGLATRPSNTTCSAPARTNAGGNIALVDAFPNLPNLSLPMKIVQPLNDGSIWYAVLRSGGLDRFNNNANVSSAERYLNLAVTASGEGGFLSAVFHPNWPSTKEIYVSYTVNGPGFESRLSRLVIIDDSSLPATYTEEILLTVDQPYTNHNGGDLVFGPDGFLYYGLGDGGDANDPHDNGQTTSRLLGSILRIDVNGVAFPSPGYTIPATNPFAANSKCGPADNAADCPEIFAWGLRNPWRMSFDEPTGNLWVGDVGQNAREEIDLVTINTNYGWRCREGFQATANACAGGTFADPIFDYGRSAGDNSITGGFVYRGARVPSLAGKYIFADYGSGRIWSLENQASNYVRTELADLGFNVAGLSQDNNGEVYVLGIGTGRILYFESSGGSLQDNVPDNLIDTGCVDSSNPSLPASGLIPYAPVAPFWSDGADKSRWLALPNGSSINASNAQSWDFPPGSVLMKHFELNEQLLETRLFMRHPDGDWAGYTYQWNDAQTVATRVRNGVSRVVGAQTWIYPSENDCLSCHTQVADFVLGLETAQLNSDFLYPSSGITDNQLEVFNHINLFTADVAEPVSQLPALADPFDITASLDERARAYLHTNCAQCHQPNGTTGTDLDLRFATALAATNTCDAPPQAGDLGIGNARLIAPGDSARSVLIERTNRRDSNAMPPLASNRVDDDGVQLLRDWVDALTGCS